MTHTKELKSRIYRKYRNYYLQYVIVNDKEYQIDKIIIYDGEKTLLKFGWFEQDQIFLDTEIKLRRKINLTRKENFIIKSDDPHKIFPKRRYTLYIHHKNIQISPQGITTTKYDVYQNYNIIDSVGNIDKHQEHIKSLDTKKLEIRANLENTLSEFKSKLFYHGPLPSEELEKSFTAIRNLNNDLEKEIQNIEKTKQQIQQGIIKEEGLKC